MARQRNIDLGTIVVAGCGHAEVPIVRAAQRQGYRVVTIGHDAMGMAHRLSDKAVYLDYSRVAHVVDTIVENKADGLISGCNDFSLFACAEAAEALGLCGFDSLTAVSELHYKHRFRALQQSLGLPHPRFTQDRSLASELDFPIMVKPVDLTGGKGISRVDSADKLAVAIECAAGETRRQELVFEQFIEGTKHAALAWIVDQKVVFIGFDREDYADAGFLVCQAISHHGLPKDVRLAVQDQIETIAGHLQLIDGLFHTQFICSSTGPALIEVMRRPPGDLYLEFAVKAWDFEISDSLVKNALGRPSELSGLYRDGESDNTKPVIRRVLLSDRSGVFISMDNKLVPGVQRHSSYVPLLLPGNDVVQPLRDKIGIIFHRFESFEELELAVEHDVYEINCDD